MSPRASAGPPRAVRPAERHNRAQRCNPPLGQWCAYKGYSPGVVFFTNFLAIIPLASILGHATEALSMKVGQLIGGFLNATFGNAVEMIMCVQTVKAGMIHVVQFNLLGSILSNLLLVLGMAIFASGLVRHEQQFNAKGAAANMTCQLVASTVKLF